MSCGLLVLDKMPENCKECQILSDDDYSQFCPYNCVENSVEKLYEAMEKGVRPDFCPLKELPEKKDFTIHPDTKSLYMEGINHYKGYVEGWNACIDKLT